MRATKTRATTYSETPTLTQLSEHNGSDRHHDRKVRWYVDPVGNTGKTWMRETTYMSWYLAISTQICHKFIILLILEHCHGSKDQSVAI